MPDPLGLSMEFRHGIQHMSRRRIKERRTLAAVAHGKPMI